MTTIDKFHFNKETREVTKMTATSTTPSSGTAELAPGSAGLESDSDIKRKKKKKGFPCKEQKGKEETCGNSVLVPTSPYVDIL